MVDKADSMQPTDLGNTCRGEISLGMSACYGSAHNVKPCYIPLYTVHQRRPKQTARKSFSRKHFSTPAWLSELQIAHAVTALRSLVRATTSSESAGRPEVPNSTATSSAHEEAINKKAAFSLLRNKSEQQPSASGLKLPLLAASNSIRSTSSSSRVRSAISPLESYGARACKWRSLLNSSPVYQETVIKSKFPQAHSTLEKVEAISYFPPTAGNGKIAAVAGWKCNGANEERGVQDTSSASEAAGFESGEEWTPKIVDVKGSGDCALDNSITGSLLHCNETVNTPCASHGSSTTAFPKYMQYNVQVGGTTPLTTPNIDGDFSLIRTSAKDASSSVLVYRDNCEVQHRKKYYLIRKNGRVILMPHPVADSIFSDGKTKKNSRASFTESPRANNCEQCSPTAVKPADGAEMHTSVNNKYIMVRKGSVVNLFPITPEIDASMRKGQLTIVPHSALGRSLLRCVRSASAIGSASSLSTECSVAKRGFTSFEEPRSVHASLLITEAEQKSGASHDVSILPWDSGITVRVTTDRDCDPEPVHPAGLSAAAMKEHSPSSALFAKETSVGACVSTCGLEGKMLSMCAAEMNVHAHLSEPETRCEDEDIEGETAVSELHEPCFYGEEPEEAVDTQNYDIIFEDRPWPEADSVSYSESDIRHKVLEDKIRALKVKLHSQENALDELQKKAVPRVYGEEIDTT